jgi:hypothetical protein
VRWVLGLLVPHRQEFAMRFIPTSIHGIIDFVVGALLIAAPWLFGFDRGGAETWIPVILGVSAIGYSLCTQYEYGVYPVISMPTHLTLDAGSGILLAASPWLFGFADYVWAPHLIVGLFEIGAAATTVPTAGVERMRTPGGAPLPPG